MTKKVKMNRYFLLAAFTGFLMCWHFSGAANAQDSKPKYKVGQMWSYKTRSIEPSSTFIVLKIENDGKYNSKENIIHVAVKGLKFANQLSESGYSNTFIFLSIYEPALNKSAVKLVKTDVQLPDYKELYNDWRESRNKGVGGAVYTVPLTNCIALEEESISNLAKIIQEYKKDNALLPAWIKTALQRIEKQLR